MGIVLMVALLALSVLPAPFSYLGKTRHAFVAGLLFLIALLGLASVQNPGRNMTVFVPLALAWIMLALVITGIAGTVGYVRRKGRENS
jgi:hypothetical protein